jgi:3,4-dihydroxy 2-butanone 4-phosphate synthase/GTP cyclohydrolase II
VVQRLELALDLREYRETAEIIKTLNGDAPIRLMTNNPKKIVGLEGYGLEIVERVPIEMPATGANLKYLRTKREKMGHLLENL